MNNSFIKICFTAILITYQVLGSRGLTARYDASKSGKALRNLHYWRDTQSGIRGSPGKHFERELGKTQERRRRRRCIGYMTRNALSNSRLTLHKAGHLCRNNNGQCMSSLDADTFCKTEFSGELVINSTIVVSGVDINVTADDCLGSYVSYVKKYCGGCRGFMGDRRGKVGIRSRTALLALRAYSVYANQACPDIRKKRFKNILCTGSRVGGLRSSSVCVAKADANEHCDRLASELPANSTVTLKKGVAEDLPGSVAACKTFFENGCCDSCQEDP